MANNNFRSIKYFFKGTALNSILFLKLYIFIKKSCRKSSECLRLTGAPLSNYGDEFYFAV